jgi:hypothetical protein
MTTGENLQSRIAGFRKCPRLREHCRTIARDKRAAFCDWNYGRKPIAGSAWPAAKAASARSGAEILVPGFIARTATTPSRWGP